MLAWVDLETTGLEPREGQILEVALLFTDDELRPLGEPFQRVVTPETEGWFDDMDHVVVDMHSRSGLLGAVVASRGKRPHALPQVEKELVLLARQNVGGETEALKKVPLCGDSVHFDRAWLKRHTPAFEALFSHRNVDVSTLRELATRWNPEARPDESTVAHRALADVQASIAKLDHYRRTFLIAVRP